MPKTVILSAARTPIGKLGGGLASVDATELGGTAIKAALERAEVAPDEVQHVIMGQVLQAGQGQIPSRQAQIKAGIPIETSSETINKVCASGIRATCLLDTAIRAGDLEIGVGGGMESMSRAPYLLEQGRYGYRLGHGQLVDEMIRDGLWCAFEDCHMGVTAENVARDYEVTREDQDAFAAQSQRKAGEAIASGRFKDEILPVPVKRRKETVIVDTDEHPRPDTTAETLAALRAAFDKEGSVTAGNASGINDGAAAVVVMSATRAQAEGRTPLARIRAAASAGVEPRVMGMGPVPAARRAMERAGVSTKDIDLFELNEAFAAQSVAVGRELAVPEERLNVNGGAIALGHPIGASGTRILTTLLYEMGRRDSQLGMAAMCIGGGQGIALIVERV